MHSYQVESVWFSYELIRVFTCLTGQWFNFRMCIHCTCSVGLTVCTRKLKKTLVIFSNSCTSTNWNIFWADIISGPNGICILEVDRIWFGLTLHMWVFNYKCMSQKIRTFEQTCSDKKRKQVSLQVFLGPCCKILVQRHPLKLYRIPYQGFHQIWQQQTRPLVHSLPQQMFGVSQSSQQSTK